MKIALCLSGLAEGTNDIGRNSGGIDYSFPHFKEHFFDKYDVDVFAHSWSTEAEDKILDLFKPKKYIIEKQIKFKPGKYRKIPGHKRDQEAKFGKALAKGRAYRDVVKGYHPPKNRKQQCYSQWYSRKKSVELKKEYEIENNFTYDFVMISRFDVCFFTDIPFADLDSDYLYAPENTDPLIDGKKAKYNAALIYKKNPERVEFKTNSWKAKGLMDFWFLSSSKNMDEFAKLFDHLDSYFDKKFHGCEHAATRHARDMILDWKEEHREGPKDASKSPCKALRQILHRTKDYELVRRWYLDSIY